MKLEINFKQARATSVGDVNSPNLLVYHGSAAKFQRRTGV